MTEKLQEQQESTEIPAKPASVGQQLPQDAADLQQGSAALSQNAADLETKRAFVIKFAYYAIIIGLCFVVLRYGIGLLLPFFFGLIIAFILVPLVNFTVARTGIRRKIISILALLLFYGVIVLLIIWLGFYVSDRLQLFISHMPQFFAQNIMPALNIIAEQAEQLSPEYGQYLDTAASRIFETISSLSSYLVGVTTSAASAIPSLIIKLIFTVLSSVIITIDYQRIRAFVLRQFSAKNQSLLINIKHYGINTVGQLIRAYALLMFITFCELSIGLSIMHVKNSVLLAGLIAIVDILPILGTGTVLIPWSLIELLLGNFGAAIGTLILYGIISLVRYSLEPKVVGNKIGVHPVAVLMCMFVGAKLLGVLGIFLLPITITVLKKLSDEGIIKLFK